MGNVGLVRDREERAQSERIIGEEEEKAKEDGEYGRFEEWRSVRGFPNRPWSICGRSLCVEHCERVVILQT